MYLQIINSSFLDNKYTKLYIKIIQKALSENRSKLKKDSPTYIYYEGHHILPKCIWPEYSNLKSNLWNKVLLTFREHFICHWLLCKTFSQNNYKSKMEYAFTCLNRGRKSYKKLTTKQIEIIKIYRIKSNENKEFSSETRKKMSLAKLGKTRSITEEHKNNLFLSAQKRKGIKLPKMSKERMSGGNPMARKCSIEGTVYDSVSEAGRILNIYHETIRQRLLKPYDRWKEWFYVT